MAFLNQNLEKIQLKSKLDFVFVSFPYKLIVYIFAITFSIAFLNQSLENIQLESKLDFTFVSFQYKLNFLDFCCYFFSELISIFFILFQLRYFVCGDIERNKL